MASVCYSGKKTNERVFLSMEFLLDGIRAVTWQQGVMYLVGILLIWLAIKKDCEPTLLLPMGFGAILVNLPFTGVLNQVMSGVGETNGIIEWLFDIGIEASEALPTLLFIGIGAMIDFGLFWQIRLCSCLALQLSLVSFSPSVLLL